MTFLNKVDGNWNILKGSIREQLARMNDNKEAQKAGKWEKMIGEIQVELGISRKDAERKLEELQREAEMEMIS